MDVIDIRNEIGIDSIIKGRTYPYYKIRYINSSFNNDLRRYINNLKVVSSDGSKIYDILIENNGYELYNYSCTCKGYEKNKTCKHIGAVVYFYGYRIFSQEHLDDLTISNIIINSFNKKKTNKERHIVKKRLNFKVELELDYSPSFRISVGDKKLYVVNSSKLSYFLNAVNNGGTYTFGKNFTYDSSLYYIDSKDKKILDFLCGYEKSSRYYNDNPYDLSNRELKYLIDILGNKNINIYNHGVINEVKYGMPTKYNLKKDENYILNIEDFSNYNILNEDSKYVIYNKDLYILDENDSKLLNLFKNYEVKELNFTNENITKFKEGLFNNIKNNIVIDENITDIKLPTKPIINLYFDIDKDLKCKVIFDYNGNKINYFDKENDIRDLNEENKVVSDLTSDNFIIENNNFVIEDDDLYYDFIENNLNKYLDKYNVYLDKKIQNSSFKKNLSTSNNFSIGKDNILSYKFNVDGIDNNELNNVFKALRQKKKYYRLKNNDIIKLDENEELNQLNDLMIDLNLNSDDIEEGNAVIPKYRAIYIDSLKENKFKNINTNNLFDEFIINFKKYKDLKIEFSKKDNELLRDYQKDGIRWLKTIYKCDMGGILADEMGLGKTLQTIILIKEILKEKADSKILIVSPTSLVYNWKKEFDKFAPELKYVAVAESKAKRKEIFDKKDDYNIFITSYGLVRNDNDEYETLDFELCVIDEAQTIKNYKAGMTKEVKKIKSNCKIALTGTPVENNITELWSIFDFIMPGYLNSVLKFREKYNISDINDESKKILDELKKQITPFILRRKKNDVLKSLPEKIENNIYVELPDKQKKLYVNVLDNTKKEMDEIIQNEGFEKARFKILSLLTKLRQICIDPNVMYENYDGESIKLESLLNIVKENIENGHKILIFSSFKRVLENVKKKFDEKDITNYMIDGEVKSKDRIMMVDAFNKDNTNCFLITLKSGGTGLNLTSADVVIHLDIWWNPQVENQATDRAHRIGQKNVVNVIKLITKGTIEERILELQEKKKFLSDNLIENNSDSTLLSKLSEKDIKNLLSFTED